MAAYYNEIDPYAAQWLRNLIAAGHIAPGDVDERSIEDVRPDELRPYTQCHFFAGIGVWSYALRRAEWPDHRSAWTGSCPCQPFSAAGKGAGFDDQRHLWPAWHWLIQERRPPTILGEQVASKNADPWLDLVSNDLEALGFAFGALAFPAASVGAPHIRDRTYFVAYSQQHDRGCQATAADHNRTEAHQSANRPGGYGGAFGGMEHASGIGRERRQKTASRHNDDGPAPQRPESEHGTGIASPHRVYRHNTGPVNGFWADADWLLCRDGKWRPVEPGTFPLAHGAAARVGRLRAYGNAINAVQAQLFIQESMRCIP